MAATALAARSTSPPSWKAIQPPFGDHEGREPKVVSWRAWPPATGTSHSPPRPLEWKASAWPSGDQEGCTFWPPSRVTCTSRLPAFSSRTYSSKAPLRSELKATLSPSGDRAGNRSRPVEVVTCTLLSGPKRRRWRSRQATKPLPSTATRPSTPTATKARRRQEGGRSASRAWPTVA